MDLESWVPNVAELAMPAEFIVAADAGSPQLGEAAVLAVELKRSQAHPVRRSSQLLVVYPKPGAAPQSRAEVEV